MRLLRFVLTPGFLMFVIIGLYTQTRVEPGARSQLFAILGFSAFAAIELVTVGALLLRSERSKWSITAHSLNSCGAMLLAYSSLDETGLPALVTGSLVFTTGMLLWQRDRQAETFKN